MPTVRCPQYLVSGVYTSDTPSDCCVCRPQAAAAGALLRVAHSFTTRVPRSVVIGHRTVFLDRDGVINRMRLDYVKSWSEFELLPGALEAIVRLGQTGRDLIVLTNQSGIAQELVDRQTVDEIHSRFAALVVEHGGNIRGFLVCPHSKEDRCDCRKPAPGLFLRARNELGVDLQSAIMVGDQMWDIEAARAAGCDAILIDAAGATASLARVVNCKVVADLAAAADLICGE